MPELDRTVPGTDKPLWFVLDKLDDAFEVVDGWAAAPDIRTAKARTLTTLDDLVDDHGVVELTAVAAVLTLPASELEAWLRWCGVALADGWILTRTRSMDDHAAAVLAIAGEPLGLEEIASRTGRDLNIRSLANRLNEDDRFVRTDKAAWALAGWRHEQYSGIRAEIARVLQQAGGEIELQTLVDDLCARFDVSPNSVQTYASSGEYELRAGVVRRRTSPPAPSKAAGGHEAAVPRRKVVVLPPGRQSRPSARRRAVGAERGGDRGRLRSGRDDHTRLPPGSAGCALDWNAAGPRDHPPFPGGPGRG